MEIAVGERLPSVTHAYTPDRVIELIPFWCTIISGEPVALEHAGLVWGSKIELSELNLGAADVGILRNLK